MSIVLFLIVLAIIATALIESIKAVAMPLALAIAIGVGVYISYQAYKFFTLKVRVSKKLRKALMSI